MADKNESIPTGHIRTASGEVIPMVPEQGTEPRKNVFYSKDEHPVPIRRRHSVDMGAESFAVDRDTPENLNTGDLRDYMRLYTRLQWVFRGVFEIASAIAQIPFRVTLPLIDDETRKQTVPRHSIRRLLRKPNDILTNYELWRSTVSYLLLAGTTYWFKERDDIGIVNGLNLPRPDRIEPKKVASGEKLFINGKLIKPGQQYYKQRFINGPDDTWSHQNVVHFSLFNPLSDNWGLPHVKAGEDSAIIGLYLMTSDKAYWKNAINPRFIAKSQNELSAPTYERLKFELKNIHQGSDRHHDVAILEGIDLEELVNRHHVDRDVKIHRDMTRDEILGSIGCHHLVALFNGGSRSNLEVAYRIFWEQTVLPLAENIAQSVTRGLIWEMPPAFTADQMNEDWDITDQDFEFDTRRIRALRESEAVQSLVDFRDRQLGNRTQNEVRYDRNLGPPLPGGDDPTAMLGGPSSSVTRTDRNEFRQVEPNLRGPQPPPDNVQV